MLTQNTISSRNLLLKDSESVPLVQGDREYQCWKAQGHLSPLSIQEILQAQAALDVLLFPGCLLPLGDLSKRQKRSFINKNKTAVV